MRQRTLVTLLVLGALLYAFFIIPKLAGERHQVKQYDSYSDFLDDFDAGKIATVKVVGTQAVQGDFKPNAGGKYDKFKVQVQDPDLMSELQARKEQKGLEVQVGAANASLAERILMVAGTWLIPLVLIIFFWLFMVRQMNNTRGQALSFGRSQAKMLADHLDKVTFGDVAGMEEVKEELQEVVEFLKAPERFRALGAKIPRGVLLVGPPGCGKTLLARAVAGEAGVAFFYISGSDFVEMFVGVGASRVRDLFDQAKAHLPAIVFIDELDAVGRLRGAGLGGGHDEREQTLNALLVEMDGFDPNDDVILLAATNRPDILDPALLRPGRFDRRVVVPLPDVNERKDIFEIYVKDKPADVAVDVDVLARRTVGFSGADIENVVNEAALLAARKDKHQIDAIEFDEAIERVIAGPERKSRVISENERRVLAYHEAGHALLGHLLPNFDAVYKVTILPRGMSLGYTISLPEDDRYIMSKREILDRMVQHLGGRAAEELALGEIHTGAHHDLEVVSQLARQMVCEYGMSDELGPITYGRKVGPVFLAKDMVEERNYSEEIAAQIDEAIRRMVDQAYDRARSMLSARRESLDRLVEVLLERETLDQKQVEAIVETGALPEEPQEEQPKPEPEGEEERARERVEPRPDTVPPGLPEAQTP
jgi:cell division protease FtsH